MPIITGTVYDDAGLLVDGRIVRSYRRDNGKLLAQTKSGWKYDTSLSSGLTTWYKLKKDVNDSIGVNNATNNGAISQDYSYYFNGSSSISRVYFAGGLIPHASPYSVFMWIKSDELLPSTVDSNLRRTPFTGAGPVWSPGIWVTATMIRGHALTEYRDVTINIPSFEWVHIGQVFDGTTVYLVVNGVKYLGTRTTYTSAQPSQFIIGGETTSVSSVNSWKGEVTDFRIYNRVVTDSEILKLYQEQAYYISPLGVRTTGQFTLENNYTGEANVLFLDDTPGTVYNDIVHRTIVS
jgi:hypothetical protein